MLYEVKYHRIKHRSDTSLTNQFKIDNTLEKSVRFESDDLENENILTQEQKDIKNETLFFYVKFQSLNFYYAQVFKHLGGGFCPSFYRFRIQPMDGSKLNRVYEVEEHMGKTLLEEVARLHKAHQVVIEHAKDHRKTSFAAW